MGCFIVVASLILSSIGFFAVFADVSQLKGTWSDSFDGANPEEGIAASTNITVADGAVNLSKTSSDWMRTTQADFEAGVLSDVDTTTSSGDVKLALAVNGHNIYALRGHDSKDFGRYDIAGDEWTEMADNPSKGKEGKGE